MKLLKLIPPLLVALFFATQVSAQAKLDSLTQALQQQTTDSSKCDVYLQLSNYYLNTQTEMAALYADSAITLANSLKDDQRLLTAYDLASSALWYNGDYYKAIHYTKKAIAILEVLKDTTALGNEYNGLGLNYKFLSQYETALEFTLKALAITETQNDSSGRIILYSNVGDLYRQLGEPQKSLDYQAQAKVLNDQLQIPIFKGIIAYCTAFAHQDLGNYQQALAEYDEALKIGKELNYPEVLHRTLNNIAKIHIAQQNFPKALSTGEEALKVARTMKSARGETLSLLNIGKVFQHMNTFQKAEDYYQKALSLSISGKMNDLSRDTYEALSDLYFDMKDYKQSLSVRKKYETLKDSIFTVAKTKQVAEAQELYQTEKKQKEIENLKLQQDADQAIIQQQRTQTLALAAFSIIIVVVGIIVFRNRQQLKQANLSLNEKNNAINTQNEELQQQAEEIKTQRDFIEEQKDLLSDKNVQLTDSIRYAKTIQEALLPFEENMGAVFANHGIIFRPKDIVSGDFFWLERVGNKTLLAVIDCTGHGVPGAFMSIIGLSLLNDEVVKKNITDPSEILTNLHTNIQRVLQQDQSTNVDGMDIALCLIEEENEVQHITFAGARRPLYYLSQADKSIHQIKGDKKSVGGMSRRKSIGFTNRNIQLQKGDILYLTTDGFVDQNNAKGRKFGSINYANLLGELTALPLPEQVSKIEKALDDFMFGQAQRDDITIVAVEL